MAVPTHALSSKSQVKPRPRWLKALGLESPPESLQIASVPHRLRELFKHDSWAATALYENPEGVLRVVKLHRQAPVLGLPLGWLGRRTAQNERTLLEQLAGLQGIPALAGPVRVAGPVLRHAVAREYVAGHPLGNREVVSDTFFHDLNRLLEEMHKRRTVYVDLHKRENIIVSEQDHLVAAIGVEDLVIVHTPDATLVCRKVDAQRIKDLAARLEKEFGGKHA